MNEYQNPLTTRYASPEMSALWSPQRKHSTWRRLWVALAEAEQELGLAINDQQIEQLRAKVDDINWAAAHEYEKNMRHDVMAHVHAFGAQCPAAKAIIHLGATSAFVGDNTDLILMREALVTVRRKVVAVLDALAGFAEQWQNLPTLGYTHFQPAQLTTVGKRACLWCYDLLLDLEEIEHRIASLRFRGVKGTTGTQASYLELFAGDHDKVARLEQLVAEKMGFEDSYAVTGQTYSRKVDGQVLATLGDVATSAQKFAHDLRLLAGLKQLEEPFAAGQIGSSAMAYKRNPMRSERMTSLSRFLLSLVPVGAQTAATQWFERTLDDSAAKRIVIPEAFLAADAVLKLYLNVARGLVVYPKTIARAVAQELPFMATEAILMAGVTAGGDRQELHEAIRQHSQAAAQRVKEEGLDNDLIDRLRNDPCFAGVSWDDLLDPQRFVGRAPDQVTEFIAECVQPVRQRYPDALGQRGDDVEV